jgi:hypothetical protein
MKNITLITSVIDTPNIPLSYTPTRSVFTKEIRFEQLKKTIATIREKIPDNRIILVECSILSEDERQYLTNAVDYFLNIYDTNDQQLIQRMFTPSKTMGEGTMTIYALQYLLSQNIEYDNFFKISGRYWLNDSFSYEFYDNYMTCIRHINGDSNNVYTCFYKLSYYESLVWLDYLRNSENEFVNCMGYEFIFSQFLKSLNRKICIINNLGVNGYISVDGNYIDV